MIDLSWNQQIEATTGASKHVSFVQQAGNRFNLGEEFNKKMLVTLSMINQRLNDEKLYITVVGQASTGKSTFINALLGGVLLEAHVNQMTTTTSTKVVYGSELAVHVQFKEEAADTAFQTWGLGIIGGKRVGKTGWQLKNSDGTIVFMGEKVNLRNLIAKLTTSDNVAKYLDVVTIYYPSEFLKSGIVLIDTPGANATNQSHKEITRKAVAQSDTSIIITAGDQAITGWLVESFSEATFLRPFIHRCVFVMTRMDVALSAVRRVKMSRQEAIDMIYQDALQRLTISLKNIGLAQKPNLLFCAAQSVLEPKSDETDHYWISEFQQMKETLFQRMINQRIVSISESVLRLIEDCLQYMEIHLSKLWQEFNTKKDQLETAVHDLDDFCSNQKKRWKKDVKKVGGEVSVKVEMTVIQTQENAMASLRQRIFGAASMDQLKTISSDINPHVKPYLDGIESGLREQLNLLSYESQNFVKKFDKEFLIYYQKLDLVSHSNVGVEKVINSLSKKNSLNLGVYVEDDEAGGRLVGGAILGGLAAVLLSGPLLPFAIIGGIIAIFSQPSLDETKSKVWNELEPKLKNLFKDVKEKAVQSVDDYQSKVEADIKQYIMSYEKKYSNVVKEMRSIQDTEYNNIFQQQKDIEITLENLRKRRQNIKTQQEGLKLRQ